MGKRDERASILGTKLYPDGKPTLEGTRVTVQGSLPEEELLPATRRRNDDGAAIVYPEN
jgi:hypothetical protein